MSIGLSDVARASGKIIGSCATVAILDELDFLSVMSVAGTDNK